MFSKDPKNVIIAILLIIAGILYFKSCGKGKLETYIDLYEASQDVLHQTRNKLGQEVTKTSLLVAEREKDLLKIKSKDSSIIALQKVVKDYKGKLAAATVLSNSTTDSGTTVTLIEYDTIKTDTGQYIYPTYTSEWKERWSEGYIKAGKDYVFRDIKVKNEFEITQGWEKQGFLKKKKPLVTVVNLNPNTVTQELKSFFVQPYKNKISIGLGACYGFDIIGLKPTVVVGPTVHIPILSL